MHTRNPFKSDYNFDLLIEAYPKLKEHVFVNDYGNKTIKFGDKDAVKALNTALLLAQYGVTWDIPENNLCPPIPGRLDYLLHIEDLVGKKDLRLLDIGTGASLIYPILASCHFNWEAVGTEVDRDSLQNAQEIINNNKALEKIELRPQQFKSKILEGIIQPNDSFDVVVCNPPFFKNKDIAKRQNKRKAENLGLPEEESSNFGGLSNELWYKGGEEAFVKTMASESAQYKDQVHWFTSLVSNKDNLKNIKRAINKTLPTEVKVIDLDQGNKKSRFVAWTFR